MVGISVKATAVRDTSAVDQLAKEVLRVEAKSTQLLESALLCLTAYDEKEAVVGYLCLDDTPCVRLGESTPAGEAWVAEAAGPRLVLCSTAFIRAWVIQPLYEIEVAGALLRAVFTVMPSLQSLLMATAKNISFSEPGLAAVFSRTASSKDTKLVLYEGVRSAVLAPLTIRAARVEDHDDMLPILERSKQTLPALARLPDSSRPQEPFALTRLVADQDERNRVLVAEADDGRLVGFMVVTSDVDTGSLAETFDLHPYDNFLPSEVYEEQYTAARESVRQQKYELLQDEAARRAAAKAAAGGEQGDDAAKEGEGEGAEATRSVATAASEDSPPDESNPAAGEAGAASAAAGGDDGEPEMDIEVASTPTEEEVRSEMLAMFAGRPDNVEPTLFAVTMLCVDEANEPQAHDFLQHAFAAFPGKLYCVARLPHSSREPALMDSMTRVAPMPGSLYPEVLFMYNRHALNPHFTVRLGTPADAEQVAALTEGMPNAAEIQESFGGAAAAGTAVVAVCEAEVVGLCTVNPEVDLELLQANFGLSSHIDLAHQPPECHGEVDMYTMNPIFVHRHREFLACAMRLLGKAALYYALPPGQQPPDMVDVLSQVAPRHRLNDKLQAEFALYMFTRRAAFRRRRSINSQVVVVGASECGLAVLERLLLDTELQFNYLTLLAPGGIKVGGTACQYTGGVIAKLGLEARALLLDADMIGLDRAGHVVDLSDGSQLAYDQLVITAGTQDQSRYRFAEQDPEVAGLLVTELELAADFTMNDAAAMASIFVCGDSLGSYHALGVLESKGASDKTRFLAPPGQRPKMVDLLHEVAAQVGLALPQPEPLEVASMSVMQEGGAELRAIAVLQGPADEAGSPGVREECAVDLLAGCEPASVSRALFGCVNDASLVFDGRLVVDGAFRTNDPHIYAGGTIARLSRRYGGMHLEHYNSRDVGRALAASLSAHFLENASGSSSGLPPVPTLQQARVVGCGLPGGMAFMFAGTPSALASPSQGCPEGGMAMQTSTERGYMQVNLAADGTVYSIIYLGRVAVPAVRLSALVGLHANYLNQLAPKYADGSVPDLLTFLMDTWSELLYHDGFREFQGQLLDMALASVAVGGRDVEGGLVEMVTHVQDAVLEYVRARASELPGYEVPSAARARAVVAVR